MLDEVELVPFRVDHQAAARSLILSGLGDRWGRIDERLNPDLDDIGSAHEDGYFVIGERAGEVVATGGLLAVSDTTAKIHRMSVGRALRGRGLGQKVLAHLIEVARGRGFRSIILETTETWHDAIRFYEASGFVQYDRTGGEIFFRRELG